MLCVFPRSHCRQNHSKASHGAVEPWYGSPTPPYAPNHKLMAMEQGTSLPSGERAVAWAGGHRLGVLGGILTVAHMGAGPPSGTGTERLGAGLGPSED